jgi:hypothetical protein
MLEMFFPSKTISPEVGEYTPARRLKKVVLPAPLGPIMEWIFPGSIKNETLETASKAP